MTPFNGETTGFVINFERDKSVLFDRGKAVSIINRNYEPGQTTLLIGGIEISGADVARFLFDQFESEFVQ